MLKRKDIVGAIVGFLVLTCCGCRDRPSQESKDFTASVLGDPLEDSSQGKVPRLNPGLSLHVKQRGCLIPRVKAPAVFMPDGRTIENQRSNVAPRKQSYR